MQVLILRLEGPRLDLNVNGNGLHLAVEDPHQVTIPTDPYPATGIESSGKVWITYEDGTARMLQPPEISAAS